MTENKPQKIPIKQQVIWFIKVLAIMMTYFMWLLINIATVLSLKPNDADYITWTLLFVLFTFSIFTGGFFIISHIKKLRGNSNDKS